MSSGPAGTTVRHGYEHYADERPDKEAVRPEATFVDLRSGPDAKTSSATSPTHEETQDQNTARSAEPPQTLGLDPDGAFTAIKENCTAFKQQATPKLGSSAMATTNSASRGFFSAIFPVKVCPFNGGFGRRVDSGNGLFGYPFSRTKNDTVNNRSGVCSCNATTFRRVRWSRLGVRVDTYFAGARRSTSPSAVITKQTTLNRSAWTVDSDGYACHVSLANDRRSSLDRRTNSNTAKSARQSRK